MQSKAATVEQYIAELPAERQKPIKELRRLIKKNLPKGFKECMGYGMMAYVVPHSLYPPGYHCDPKSPLGFINLASQKNFISFYHMCLYGDNKLTQWFKAAYEKAGVGKLDMGKCCVRFKNMEKIPYELIGELCSKITVEQWIEIYEKNMQR